ncbi:AAA family ATPase [Pontibacillus sp. ALD_SL1]|uniref:ATP-dependent nuclease n=1 Tax=Pontibacillus sp. ALD_SL1 TaxID=2777185 RepID=UPI001A9740A5|nr:AAA family ATPase [Pontibacillus sp. ALD_SL1]QST00327.1 AAA family ATPase [Pontibacillus sp. ALD_SL1]
MYLKSVRLENFRKFSNGNNVIEFVDSRGFKEREDGVVELNVAKTTTLIVGKNNTGKTTVIKALELLLDKSVGLSFTDINMNYLKELFSEYIDSLSTGDVVAPIPKIKFEVVIGLEDDSSDLISNLAPFMTIANAQDSELIIKVKYEPENIEEFAEKLHEVVEDDEHGYGNFIKLVQATPFKVRYFSADDEPVNNFTLKQLIELRSIKANNVTSENCLSNAFNKIVKYRSSKLEQQSNVEDIIESFNTSVTNQLKSEHTDSINESVGKIETSDHISVRLSSNISFDDLLNKLVKYEYVENGLYIPENQFGLGYTNLMMIIADLIEYMERYPEDSFNSRINLISIEEPETFMHPQMQENFIKSINEAITTLLEGKNKNVNSQLIITTHSSHILNSKIHSGGSFDYINYISSNNNESEVVCLKDGLVAPSGLREENEDKNKKDFEFLKKHIKYRVSELFFSDAVIFVEGTTEEVLINYHLDNDETLNKYYISVFNIDGAHGLVYHNLIQTLRVPTLIITDLDIKREKAEKDEYLKMTTLDGRVTTNQTLIKYNEYGESIETINLSVPIENMKIVYQDLKEGVYPTSFEEAFILANHNNDTLNEVLKEVKRNTYIKIVNEEGGLKEQSYKLQRKLSSNKSDFANSLLYRYLQEETSESIPSLPQYIVDGLSWLKVKLGEGE